MIELKILRAKKALSQRELSAMAGISVSTYNRLEKGLEAPIPKTRRKLAKVLGIKPEEIIFIKTSEVKK